MTICIGYVILLLILNLWAGKHVLIGTAVVVVCAISAANRPESRFAAGANYL